MRPQIRELWSEQIDSNMSILHDNARLHVAQPVVDLLTDYA